jgi:leucyl-tRNA synthetase
MLYSRFWHHFLYDIGEVNTPEPYAKRTIQGLILGSDGDKMSKSKGNVIDPLDIVDQYGADTLRTYVLFMGDYAAAAPWSDTSVKGCRRFLERVAGMTDLVSADGTTGVSESDMHKTVKKVSSDIENMKFNTAIAALMTLSNTFYAAGKISSDQLVTFIKLLCPFAPHITEEIWSQLGHTDFLSLQSWPTYDEAKTVDETVEIAIQVNGKLRARMTVPKDISSEEAIAQGKTAVADKTAGMTFVKEIYIPGRLVNLVVK